MEPEELAVRGWFDEAEGQLSRVTGWLGGVGA